MRRVWIVLSFLLVGGAFFLWKAKDSKVVEPQKENTLNSAPVEPAQIDANTIRSSSRSKTINLNGIVKAHGKIISDALVLARFSLEKFGQSEIQRAVTNERGEFTFSHPNAASIELVVEKESYRLTPGERRSFQFYDPAVASFRDPNDRTPIVLELLHLENNATAADHVRSRYKESILFEIGNRLGVQLKGGKIEKGTVCVVSINKELDPLGSYVMVQCTEGAIFSEGEQNDPKAALSLIKITDSDSRGRFAKFGRRRLILVGSDNTRAELLLEWNRTVTPGVLSAVIQVQM